MIKSSERLPELVEGQHYSKNVWGFDGHSVGVYCLFWTDEGYEWGNCYGDVFGDALVDDHYEITHWDEIKIPEPPK